MNSTTIYKEANSELIASCRRGDNKAFQELYQLYSKSMFNVCMRILNNRDEAEDALQEGFISAFRNITRFDGKASFGSWLKRIVINRCIDSLRKRNFQLMPLDENQPEEITDDDASTFSVESVKSALSDLPEGYRVVLSLYLFEDYSHRMIAEKLQISEGTSKSQYSRARKKLAELLILKKNGNER